MKNASHQRSISWNNPSDSRSLYFPSSERPAVLGVHPRDVQSLTESPITMVSSSQAMHKQRSHSNQFGSAIVASSRRTRSQLPEFIAEHVLNSVSHCAFNRLTGVTGGVAKDFNQDSYIIKDKLKGQKGQYLFAVCDGHGPLGHLVSEFVKDYLPMYLEDILPQGRCSDTELCHLLQAAICRTVQELASSDIDTSLSGTTLICILISGTSLICANIGDSRAVLVQLKNSWKVLGLSRDHKPDLPEELARIRICGGRVEPSIGGAFRVWLPDQPVPGLAMSRAIGDSLVAQVGVTPNPEVFSYTLQPTDKFVVIASDGIWDVINSQEAAHIVINAWRNDNAEAAADLLVRKAFNRWGRHVDNSVDDITVIVIFLKISH